MAVIIPVDTYMKGINMNVQLITSLDEVVPLLSAADLPSSDLADKDNLVMFGIYDNNRLIASAGIEMQATTGLLRSVVVNQAYRHQGMAKLLVSSAEQWAKDHGLKELYLLTTTASEFFNALGYDVVVRSEVPQQIKETTQFSQLCPCSSLVMKKQI